MVPDGHQPAISHKPARRRAGAGRLPLSCAALLADVEAWTHGEDGQRRPAAPMPAATLAARAELGHRYAGVLLEDDGAPGELMARFPTADQAVSAAIHVLEVLQRQSVVGYTQTEARVGVLYGRVLADTHRLEAQALARLRQLASAGAPRQVVTTHESVLALSPGLRALVEEMEVPAKVEGLEGLRLALLDPAGRARAMLGAPVHQAHVDLSRLRLRLGPERLEVSAGEPMLTMGRNRGSTLVVRRKTVSRDHARIEYRMGRFMLIDASTNGTFVRLQDGKEVYLRHGELPLWGRGFISLGEPLSERGAVIEFVVSGGPVA